MIYFITHFKCPVCGTVKLVDGQFPVLDHSPVILSIEEEVALTLSGRLRRACCWDCSVRKVDKALEEAESRRLAGYPVITATQETR